MGKLKRRTLSADEQQILEHLVVRPITSTTEKARFDALILEHHYCGRSHSAVGFAAN